MTKDFAAGLTALLALGFAWPGSAASGDSADPRDMATQVAERFLGSADEAAQASAYLPFTRQIAASGGVTGSLAQSTAAAGVPAAAMLEALRALGTAIDLEREVKDGDRFYVRYEQGFTLEGQPIGVGRVLWAELKTAAKGTIAVHRFRPRTGIGAGIEQFWLASGKAAAAPEIGTPLDIMTLTSGFGLRKDPLDHPPGPLAGLATTPPPPAAPPPKAEPTQEEKAAEVRDQREIARAAAGFGSNGQLDSRRDGFDAQVDRIMAERRIRARREKEEAEKAEKDAAARAAALAAAPPVVEAAPPPAAPPRLYMHEGLDLLANTGTPVHAAADGMVIGAGPNGGYGNWVRLRHPGGLTTAYGHLFALAPGLEKGSMVARGELIGFVGNTGRSTGAHLHFEVLVDGRPVNPQSHPATRPAQLAGVDLERLRKQVAACLRERDQETALHVSSWPW